MSKSGEIEIDRLIDDAFGNAAHVIHAVARRGVVDNQLETDDFGELLSRREFKDLVIGELYESYFLPQRHEHEWQLLHELVSVLTSEPLKQFYALSAAGGIIGNASYAALRSMLRRVVSEMKTAKLSKVRLDPFLAMEKDVSQIETFFRKRPCARIAEVETATKISRERLHPLLKLLGFKHHRREHSCFWCRPGSKPSPK